MTAETGETRNKFLEVDILGAQIDILPVDGYNCGIQMNEVDAMAFDQSKYISGFLSENYDEVKFRVPKGKRVILRDIAKEKNILDTKGKVSLNRMIIEALEQTYHIDLSRLE